MQNGQPILINGREYRLDGVLSTGAGSYGQVWAATDPAGRSVALKFINAEAMSQADPSLHGHWRAHLQREIDFLGDLESPRSRHIIALLDHGQADGQPVLVLERLQANLGQWLFQLRRDGATPPDLNRILDWTGQILDGLDVIHRAGFVYRDLKFSNILVDAEGTLLKLADFGSLKREDGDSTRSCIGTPATMAPEQILPIRQGENGYEYAVDFRADYYALGLLLFTLLTGQATTAAQRRLGQLLAMYGQEGASNHRTELGGLTDEERILLRRAIEFWTVPVNPEQVQGGAATLLIDLLTRLLARDPAERPSASSDIRTVLATLHSGHVSTPSFAPYRLTLPPDTPPNRPHRPIRRMASPTRPAGLKRAVGLIGAAGLAGALAWATVIRPIIQAPPSTEPTQVAPSAPVVSAPSVIAPAPAVPANPTPQLATTPQQPEPSSATTPATGSVNPETSAAPTTALAPSPTAPLTAPPAQVETSESTPPPAAEPAVANTPKPPATDSDPEAGISSAEAMGSADKPMEGHEPDPEAAPITTTVKPTEVQPSIIAPTESTARSEPKPSATESAPETPVVPMQPPGKKVATPHPAKTGVRLLDPSLTSKPHADNAGTTTAIERSRTNTTNTTRKTLADRAPKPASTAVDTTTKRNRPPAPEIASRPPPRPVTKVSPPLSNTVKPDHQSLEPAPPLAAPRRLPTPTKDTERRTTEITAHPSSSAPAAPKVASPKATHPSRRNPDLPAIDLISTTNNPKTLATPVQPPIKPVNRPNPKAAPPGDTIPPIDLVSRPQRPSPAPLPRPEPPLPRHIVATRTPPPEPIPPPRTRLARPTDPIRAFQEDAGRAANNLRREAENISDWAKRTGSSVGTEIRRSLDSANQAISGLVGNCTPANGCQPARRVERRDRWSQTNDGMTPNPPSPGFRDGAGLDRPPARRPPAYR